MSKRQGLPSGDTREAIHVRFQFPLLKKRDAVALFLRPSSGSNGPRGRSISIMF